MSRRHGSVGLHPKAIPGRRLFEEMRSACSLPRSRLAVPAWALRTAGRWGDSIERIVGQRVPVDGEVVSRLLDSACYFPTALMTELGWTPRVDIAAGIRDLVECQRVQEQSH